MPYPLAAAKCESRGRFGAIGRPPYSFGQYADDSQLARELMCSIVARGGFDPLLRTPDEQPRRPLRRINVPPKIVTTSYSVGCPSARALALACQRSTPHEPHVRV